ncbi:MAG: glycosyltransferase family 2 protein [Chloroflexota bacterium]
MELESRIASSRRQPSDIALSRQAVAITVVMPALNEEESVGKQVRAMLGHPAFRRLPLAGVIVVDNGSTDRTSTVARAAGAHVVTEPRRGYGSACLAGVLQAGESDIVLLMDADGSDDLDGAAHVAALVLSGQVDLAVGSRVRGICDPGALTIQQRAGNAVATAMMRVLYDFRVTDLGPVRALRRETLLSLGMRELTHGWSVEMLIKASRAGYRVAEVPVDYHRRAGGESKVSGAWHSALRAGWSITRAVLRNVPWQPTRVSAPVFSTGHERGR